MLAGGEFVVNAAVARAHSHELEDMNPGYHGAATVAHHRVDGGWIGVPSNQNDPVVAQLRALGTTNAATYAGETRAQTSALVLEELQFLRAKVSRLRADINRRGNRPDRLVS